MRVLVTNDDGVGSPGIVALAREVVDAGHDVVVAAPSADLSGSSAAIGGMHADESIDVEPVELPGLAGVPAFAVAAPPALVVIAGRLGAFGESPDLVVSGINPGPNTGRSVLHSGTVGAALTAANLGISGLAVSVDVGDPLRWRTAAVLAGAALEWLVGQPDETVLNLNVPDRALDDVRGVRWAPLAQFGTVRAALVESPQGGLQMELSGDDDPDRADGIAPDSDTALVRTGFATLTVLEGLRGVEGSGAVEVVEQCLLRRSA
ncbi:MAG: 5'/3'-nucleotidase SurE [Actinobacteria bacterium]|nr:5'/3'-nucleotidase SurE [Actinomycetota bacterium]